MLNLDSLKDVVGNDKDMMKSLLVQFLDTTQQDMRRLQDAIAAGNSRDIVSFAHRIKGSCFVIGAHRLAELTGHLEQNARDDNKSQFVQLLEQAVAELALIREEIERLTH